MVADKRVIDDAQHLMRYVPYTQQVRNPETDQFEGVLGTAFSIRPKDKGGLSTTWLEHFGGQNATASIALAAGAYRDSMESKKIASKAYFAIGNAGATRIAAADHHKKIRLVHAPDGPNTGHVEIRRFTDEDRRLLDVLALEVFHDHHAVQSLGIPLVSP